MPDAPVNNARVVLCLLPFFLAACAGPSGTVRLPESQAIKEQAIQEQDVAADGQAQPIDGFSGFDEDDVEVPIEAALGVEIDDQAIVAVPVEENAVGALTERVLVERKTAFNPYVLTAHKHNFVLPVSYSTGINEQIYQQNDVPLREGLQPAEVKFQISLKTQLNEQDLLFANDALSLGITLEAWWQLYSSDLSSPFRETNYQPEAFYLVPLLWGPFGGNTAFVAGLEHQSNGQVQGLSRSWNRLYAMFIYEKGNFVGSIRPWYRLPEKAKESPGDAEGDDNPDILDFMGHAELNVSWRDSRYEYAAMLRGNPDTGNGAVKLGITFPLFAKFRGFVQYFSGYGDSLIDYDHYQQRLGLGVALTNLF